MIEGIFYDMSAEEYHAVTACSNSVLSTIATKSPAHIWVEREATPALVTGTALHLAVLEPHKFDDQVAVAPDVDRRTKDGKAQYADFIERNEGKTIVSAEDHAEMKMIQSIVWADDTARRLLEKGNAEVSVFWAQDGIQCKARFDFISELGVAVDLKSTRNANPDAFTFDAYKYGYHRQIAWYMGGAKVAGLELSNMFIIAAEKTAPYPVCIFDLDDESFELANAELEVLFAKYKTCKESGVWPAYVNDKGENVHTLRLPYSAFSYNKIINEVIS
jgi:exodeoxyribonuclease VIII